MLVIIINDYGAKSLNVLSHSILKKTFKDRGCVIFQIGNWGSEFTLPQGQLVSGGAGIWA